MTRLIDKRLAEIEACADNDIRALITEVREARALLQKIGVAKYSMNVETAGLCRFEAPWAFKDDEDWLSVAEIIQRHLTAHA